MTRLLDFLSLLPLLGYFGGSLPVHDHSNSGSGGVLTAANLPGTRTYGTPCVKNPYATGTITTTAHGLGVVPDGHEVDLECLAPDLNYSIGDIIDLAATNSGVGGGTGYSVDKDATNVVLGIMTGGTISISNKTTGAGTAITPASWKITVRPYKDN